MNHAMSLSLIPNQPPFFSLQLLSRGRCDELSVEPPAVVRGEGAGLIQPLQLEALAQGEALGILRLDQPL